MKLFVHDSNHEIHTKVLFSMILSVLTFAVVVDIMRMMIVMVEITKLKTVFCKGKSILCNNESY